MSYDYDMARRIEKQNAARAKAWRFRADFFHDVELPSKTWAVDGVHQEDELNEANLLAAVNREGIQKPVVTVGPPCHIYIARIIGFQPPYRHVMAELAA